MAKAQKEVDPLLSPEKAAAVAGMTRPAFLKHVGVDIRPDKRTGKDGKRLKFRLSTVLQFRLDRKKKGTKKRGFPPKRAKK